MGTHQLLDKLRLELRRGALTLAVLDQLSCEHYGYSLRQVLAKAGVEIEEGTLYPLIRRLESQGLLNSRWSTESGRKRRYYRRSELGDDLYQQLLDDWQKLNSVIQKKRGGK